MTTRDEIRTEVRDIIQEQSGVVGAIWSDALLNRLYKREMLSLFSKDIYIEEFWKTNLQADVDAYDLPDGWNKIDKLEMNTGTTANPVWTEMKGWDTFGDVLRLYFRPFQADEIRASFRKSPAVPEDDVTELDLPDDKVEVVIYGMVLRCYDIFIGYLRGARSWDSVTKPGDVSINSIVTWRKEVMTTYKQLLGQYATVPRPRDIDLVS